MNSADNDYQINCCGFVSAWEVYITTTDGTLYAQVWRLVNSNWTLIGQNTFEIDCMYPHHKLISIVCVKYVYNVAFDLNCMC